VQPARALDANKPCFYHPSFPALTNLQNLPYVRNCRFKMLLESLSPELHPDEYVFCSLDCSIADCIKLNPVCIFREKECTTLILSRLQAEAHNLRYCGVFRQITLNVHSSLEAIGLTAAVSNQLASHNISANVIAGFYHDHIFVPAGNSEAAMTVLNQLSQHALDC